MYRVGVSSRVLSVVLATLVLLILGTISPIAGAYAARPITRAFTDDLFGAPGAQPWISRAAATGARTVLLIAYWNGLAPNPPASAVDPRNPSDPQYSFASLDAQIRQFAGTGITPALLVTDAPGWAEAPGGPPSLEAVGAWRPSAQAFGDIAAALARRYSGSYPDPLYPGRALPRVRYFQAWAEANFSVHLAPQWAQSNGRWVATAPGMYRDMLNAFYTGIKSAHSDNVVITTGFGPYGDPPGGCGGQDQVGSGCRMPPALFTRDLLCLQGQGLRPQPCPNPAHFDALAMDPYQVSSPMTPAFNIDDVTSPDLGKLTRIVKKAVSVRDALPHGPKQLWVTEFSYDSNPPNPTAVSLATQARWLDQALYLFWTEGVNTVVWYLLRDQAAAYSPGNYYSGVYYYNGARKPSFQAFRFPFLVWPAKRTSTVWGMSPRTGRLAVQVKRRSSWRTIFRVRVSAGSVFVRQFHSRLHGNFRAVVGGEQSLVWNG
jgi:hypothetical protein